MRILAVFGIMLATAVGGYLGTAYPLADITSQAFATPGSTAIKFDMTPRGPCAGKSYDFSALSEDEQNKVSKEDGACATAASVFGQTSDTPGRLGASFDLVIALGLYDLWFYQGSLSEIEPTILNHAIRTFQQSIGATPTGILLVGEMQKLFDGMQAQEVIAIHGKGEIMEDRPSVQHYPDINHFSASGTWTLSNGGKLASPHQTLKITCWKNSAGKSYCEENTAMVDFRNGSGWLDLDQDTFSVSRWDDKELIAESTARDCVTFVISVNFADNSVNKFRRSANRDCTFDFKFEPLALMLRSGYEVGQEIYKEQQRIALEARNPNVTRVLDEIKLRERLQ